MWISFSASSFNYCRMEMWLIISDFGPANYSNHPNFRQLAD